MHVYTVVPVASFEHESVITKSIECLRELECDGFNHKVYYFIDTFLGDKRDLHFTLPNNFKIILRDNSRGRRAGAINEFLHLINDVDYVAIFDVDSRPSKNFITECIKAFKKDDSAVLSSGCRFVTNKNNVITKIVSIEYSFFCDLYRLYQCSDGFLQFNGLIGVIQASFLKKERLSETSSCEDLDLTQRVYLAQHVAVLAKTTVGEQAPTTIKDLYSQRVRWYRGSVESFAKYCIPMFKAPIPFSRKLSWFLSITVPFLGFLLAPIVVLYLGKIKNLSDSHLEFVKIFFGSIGHTWLMTVCGMVAILKHSTSSKFEWGASIRSDV
ncbi:MAG TPA: glycosyltransferase family 2 protein [Candidatus Acidoferrales bacterium]|nr:glycosyltransferase family 2 protein [Candidatus Acidoferrales bacterium]